VLGLGLVSMVGGRWNSDFLMWSEWGFTPGFGRVATACFQNAMIYC